MRAWTNGTELPSGGRFDNATSNRSAVGLEHDKRIIAQVTGLMHAGGLGRSLQLEIVQAVGGSAEFPACIRCIPIP
jgi:hypothetical protein